MERIFGRSLFVFVSFVLLTFELSVVLSSSPQNIGPAGVLLWFAGLYLTILFGGAVVHAYVTKSKKISLRVLLYWAIISQALVAVVALRSLGQLQWRDGLLLLLLTALIVWYAKRYSRK